MTFLEVAMTDDHKTLEWVEQLFFSKTGNYFSDLQKLVLLESFQKNKKTYDQIAKKFGYSPSYIKQTVAPNLWKQLSRVLGVKVTKINVRSILERRHSYQSSVETQQLVEKIRECLPGNTDETHFNNNLHLSPQELEYPEGQMALDSPFYIERDPYEQKCYQEILKPATLIHIHAPKQMGKTSLMLRIMEHAAQKNCLALSLNLQQVEQGILSDLYKFLRWLAHNVSRKLDLEPKLNDYWTEDLGSKTSCTSYFEDYLLKEIDKPIVLALDEFSLIFQYPQVAQDFLPLLRNWHEEAKHRKVWQKLRLVLVSSTENYLPLTINQSPFTVGISIQLPGLNWVQMRKLSYRYGLQLSHEDLAQLMWLVAGHPHLTRLALYNLAIDPHLKMDCLVQQATSDTGIYSSHLQKQWWYLQQHPQLVAALEQILKIKAPVELEQIARFKLQSLGLVKLENKWAMTSCNLYERYFSDRLT